MHSVRRIPDEEFEIIANTHLFKCFGSDILCTPQATNIEYFAEYYLNAEIDYFPDEDENLLGCTIFPDTKKDTFTIKINTKLTAENAKNRYRFTIAHECAHIILHNDNALKINELKNGKKLIRYSHKNGRPYNPLEWQADNLAAALLMPRSTFTLAYKEHVSPLNAHDLEMAEALGCYDLEDIFQVSNESCRIRAKRLGLRDY